MDEIVTKLLLTQIITRAISIENFAPFNLQA